MASQAPASKKLPLAAVIAGAVAIAILVAGVAYLNRPAPRWTDAGASSEAKAYLPSLALSDVTMKASENFMKQQVVEVEGKVANKGGRTLDSVYVYCLFYGVDGHEIHRERVPIVPPKSRGLKPGETRPFRLPFDALPEGWNQTLPKMVIAQIAFAG